VYDVAGDSWQYTTPLPVPLHHTMAAGVNGKLYVLGGETAGSGATSGAQPGAYQGFVDTVYEYDPANPGWRQKAPMPTRRGGGAVAVLGDKIYVAGGRPPGGADFAVYDTARDAWTRLPNLPTPRNHLAAGAIDGRIYVAGGRFGGNVGSEMTATLEVFDPRSNSWERKADMPTVRAGVNGIAARGCLYVFGGEGNDKQPNGVFEEMEVYNPRTDRWTRLQPLPTPVHGVTGAAFADGLIYLPGGGISRGGSSGVTLHQTFRADVAC
jgi:N-acetylneuraminic acid mutarotase